MNATIRYVAGGWSVTARAAACAASSTTVHSNDPMQLMRARRAQIRETPDKRRSRRKEHGKHRRLARWDEAVSDHGDNEEEREDDRHDGDGGLATASVEPRPSPRPIWLAPKASMNAIHTRAKPICQIGSRGVWVNDGSSEAQTTGAAQSLRPAAIRSLALRATARSERRSGRTLGPDTGTKSKRASLLGGLRHFIRLPSTLGRSLPQRVLGQRRYDLRPAKGSGTRRR